MDLLITVWEEEERDAFERIWSKWKEENENEQVWISHLNEQFHQLDYHLQRTIDVRIQEGKVVTEKDALDCYQQMYKERSVRLQRERQRYPQATVIHPPMFTPRPYVATKEQVMGHRPSVWLYDWMYEPLSKTCFTILVDRVTEKTFECNDLLPSDVLLLCLDLLMVCPVKLVKKCRTLTKVDTGSQMVKLMELVGE